jgi:integrase
MSKLTETFAKKTAHPSTGTRKHWDSEVKGLGLFVGKRTKTWYFQKDIGGRTMRTLIGRYPLISSAAARQTAQSLALETLRGAGKVFQTGAPTLERAIEAYLARPKLRSEKGKEDTRAQLHRHLGDWLRLPLDEITKGMVAARHGEMATVPSAANHTLRSFRTVWNHARRTHNLPETPTLAIEWFEEAPDGRVIEDLVAWRRSVDGLENPIHAAYYRLLLFTGFRRSEALTLRWQNVHADRIHLTITKNGRPFDLPIVDIHHEILEPMRSLSREWVFPAPKSRSGHLECPKRIEWSPHAHRRTFATVAMEAGILEEIVGRLLNHTPLSITGQRYARPSLDALRPAMQVVCDALEKRIENTATQTETVGLTA